MTQRHPITCARLLAESETAVLRGDFSYINTRSELLADDPGLVHFGWRAARRIALEKGWSDAIAELDADPAARPVPTPALPAEPLDPEEIAYDVGAEARLTGLDRDDCPFTDDDLIAAWCTGYDDAEGTES